MAIAFVASAINDAHADQGSVASVVAAALAVSAGDMLVVEVRWEGSTTNDAATATIADTIGNTFTPAVALASSTDDHKVSTFYCLASSGTNAANVVTATIGGARTFREITVSKFTHNGTAAYVTGTSDQVASGTSFSSGALTGVAGDLLYGTMSNYTYQGDGDVTLSGGFTKSRTASVLGQLSWPGHKISAGASETYGGTTVGGSSMVTVLLQFRESGGGGGANRPAAAHYYRHRRAA